MIDNAWSIGERQHLTPDDRLWLGVALFWSYGCVNALFALMTHGGTIVLQHHFEPGEALRLIERERCTVFMERRQCPDPCWSIPSGSSGTLFTADGTTIGTPEQVRVVVDLGAQEICNVYGLTEALGTLASSMRISHLPFGQFWAGAQVSKLADVETGANIEPGEMGEIRLRGHLMKTNDPIRTAEAFDQEGYLRTGDLGTLDEEELTYRGRLKEMVKTGGINVAPAKKRSFAIRGDR